MTDLDRRAPYGSWPSAITAELVASDAIGLLEPSVDGDDLYWLEARPAEGGRQVIVRRDARGRTADVIPEGANARTRVHEYGGGSYAVDAGTVWYCDDRDQRVYRLDGDTPVAVTPEPAEPRALRYADLVPAGADLIAVREDHSGDEVRNELVAIPSDGEGDVRVLATGRDFYASPRVHGSKLAWLEWDHPDMPWDATALREATRSEGGGLAEARTVAGGDRESVFQPEYSPDGVLHFVSDRTGWWNLYRELEDGGVEALYPISAEFGRAQWMFGLSTYAFLGDGRIVACRFEEGSDRMFALDAVARRAEPIDLAHTSIRYVVGARDTVVFVGSSPWEPPALVEFDVASDTATPVRYSTDEFIEPALLSSPEPVAFPTTGGAVAHGLYFPPTNPDARPAPDELPPLLVDVHGGPTSHRDAGFVLSDQFWTSRGFGLLRVNYRGSTGYGREYRDALRGNWGVLDVEDAVSGARYLAERGDVDPDRLVIRGGSAGGYTALMALTGDDTFAAGASYYGVADLGGLIAHTHKFESRYLDRLVPEDVLEERSPINRLDDLSAPVILLQGAEDAVVPREQAEVIVDALHASGLPFAYLEFQGEQHGFRRAETIQRALEAELSFYAQVFGFQPADDIDPVKVENL